MGYLPAQQGSICSLEMGESIPVVSVPLRSLLGQTGSGLPGVSDDTLEPLLCVS